MRKIFIILPIIIVLIIMSTIVFFLLKFNNTYLNNNYNNEIEVISVEGLTIDLESEPHSELFELISNYIESNSNNYVFYDNDNSVEEYVILENIFNIEFHISSIEDTQYLKLVNRQHEAVNTNHNLIVPAANHITTSRNNERIHISLLTALESLFYHAQREVGHLTLISGFRTYEEQMIIYNNSINNSYVMPPNHSEHQIGLAADILPIRYTSLGSMRGTSEAIWLSHNVSQFGLILRYPNDKYDITEVAYEPWHFRYVGLPHSYYIMNNHLVLEEYLELLQNIDELKIELNGKIYTISYQTPNNGYIFVPENNNFWISSSNLGGYVVTSWKYL